MLPFRIVYHEGYDLNFGTHVFPSRKYGLVRDRLLKTTFAAESDFEAPEMPADEDLLLVHEPGWLQRLRTGTLSYEEVVRLETPYSRQTVRAYFLAAGGSILAARRALRDGIGINCGGGFHHAFPGHGEGFCAINDIAVAIRALQREGAIAKALVVDCDVHQGNGTASIFAADESVLTLSIHQLNNYPAVKPPSTVDIDLPDGVGDEEYLERLRGAMVTLVEGFRPELVLYVAGADPYYQDQLGGLNLTLDGLRARDHLVMETALQNHAAVAVTFAGGYAYDIADTVTIHCNTIYAARDVLQEVRWRPARTARKA